VAWKLLTGLTKSAAPRVPRDVRVYAVGDIHGRADLLKAMFARIDLDTLERRVARPVEIYLGDYIDRGPASRDVLDQLITRSEQREMVCLKGNHEIYPGEFVRNPETLHEWAQIGGMDTLLSYGMRPPVNPGDAELRSLASEFFAAMPDTHRAFLSQLPPHQTCGDFYFVHAGVRPGVELRDQDEQDLLWIREEFLQSEDDYGKIIVHGHTPVLEPEFKPNRINIDTGAYATGRLTCLVIDDDKLSLL
jgi:serine/threonine protein phosphatase 1